MYAIFIYKCSGKPTAKHQEIEKKNSLKESNINESVPKD